MTDPTERLAAVLLHCPLGEMVIDQCVRDFHNEPADIRARLLVDARTLLAELGLVAPDPALLAAARTAEGCYTNCAGPMRGYLGDANVMCDRCAAKMDLADTILTQLEPPR